MGYSRQEYWCELPFISTGNLFDQGMEPRSLTSYADALPSELPGKGKSMLHVKVHVCRFTFFPLTVTNLNHFLEGTHIPMCSVFFSRKIDSGTMHFYLSLF